MRTCNESILIGVLAPFVVAGLIAAAALLFGCLFAWIAVAHGCREPLAMWWAGLGTVGWMVVWTIIARQTPERRT